MREPAVNQRVRLIHDVPERQLVKGEVGVLRSIWFTPESYEVEFYHRGDACDTRVLLLPEQFMIETGRAFRAQ